MKRLSSLGIAAFMLSLITLASNALAENLHAKYRALGQHWDCSSLPDSAPYRSLCYSCEAQSMDFDQQGDGGACVAKDPSAVDIPAPATASEPPKPTNFYWGAVAAGLWRDSNGGAHVATGVSWNYPTIEEARSSAISRCQANGRNCQAIDTFSNGGCGYIAIGRRVSGVHYGSSSTPSKALQLCREGGYACEPPQGNCTKEPD